MQRHPTPFQIRTLWNAATGVSILILGALLVGFIWLTGRVLGFLQPVIVPLAFAGIVAYLLDPVVRWFQKGGLSRLKAVIATFSLFLLLGSLLVAITIPVVGNQINEFRSLRQAAAEANGSEASDNEAGENEDSAEKPAPKPFDQVIVDTLVRTRNAQPWTQPVIDSLLAQPPEDAAPGESRSAGRDRLTETLSAAEDGSVEVHGIRFADTTLWSQLKGLGDNALEWIRDGTSKILGFLGLVVGFLMTPIYLYFFLKDSASIRDHWHDYVPLKASKFKTEVIGTLTEINGYMISFFRGQVLVAFIDGILIGIALTVFGLPLGLLIGIMMAIVGIIPFVGNILTLIPACLIAWFYYSDPVNASIVGPNPWANVAAVAAIFFIAQQINSMVTAPKIVGDSVGLHPMTVIFSMIFWSLILGGFVGALLAVPLTASVKVLFRRYVWERRIQAEAEPA